jgi:hypothetical protein
MTRHDFACEVIFESVKGVPEGWQGARAERNAVIESKHLLVRLRQALVS